MSTEGIPEIPADNTSRFTGNREFAPALLDPDLDIPAGIVGPEGDPAPKRSSINSSSFNRCRCASAAPMDLVTMSSN